MDALSKEQKEELATSLAALALYDGDVSHDTSFHGNTANRFSICYYNVIKKDA